MKNDLNNYGIKNPDGLIRDRFGEKRARFANDGARFVSETPLDRQREVVRQTEDFDPEKTKIKRPSASQPTASVSDLQSATDPSLAASSTASTASSAASATASASATAATAGTATGTAAAGAATVAATATTGAVAVAGTVAATVATAVIVVAVFISTLAINLSLLLAGMTSLIFRVEMTGAQDEDFETPIVATITDGEGYYDEQEVFRDTLLLTFAGLEPGTEYTVTIKNEEKVFFEKTYVTATEEVERGFLSAWHEGNEIFIIVEGVILLDNERFTVTAKDERGNVVFARDGVDEFAEYSFRFDERHNFYFTLIVGGKTAAATELRLLDEPEPIDSEYDFDAPEWSWSEDNLNASVSFPGFDGREPLTIQAYVTESVVSSPTCDVDGAILYTARAYFGDRDFTDERSVTLPATGHDYGEPSFEWTTDQNELYHATATFTCLVDGCGHTETVEVETIEKQVNLEPTCEGDGEATLVAHAVLDGVDHTDERDVTLAATGHDYQPDWEWEMNVDGWYNEDGATLYFTCSHDHTHRYRATVATVGEDRDRYIEATCEDPAESIYVATAEYEGKTYTDEQTVVWEYSALGHDFGDLYENEPSDDHFNIQKNANGEITAASMTLHCSRCDRDVTLDAAEIEVMRSEEENLCEDGGTAEYYLFWDQYGLEYAKYVETVVGPLGHDYGNERFDWTENGDGGYSGAVLVFTCSHDGEHTVTVNATVTSVSHEATCLDNACVVWTATAEYEGRTYTDTQTITDYGSVLGHDYPDPMLDDEQTGLSIEYRQNERGEITGATMTLTCARCGESETYEASEVELMENHQINLCEDGGEAEYYVFWGDNGMEVAKYKTVTVLPLDHDYADPAFNWTEDGDGGYLGVTATFTCNRNGEHTSTVTAELSHEYFAATCERGAYTLYTATLIFGGEPYSDTRTVEDPNNPATGHDYPDPNEGDDVEGVSIAYRYDEDTGAIVGATLTLTCQNCGETVSYEADEIELQSPEPDLCNGETVEYYVFWSDLEHEEYTEATLSPLGHDYSSYEFEWYEDGEGGYAANLILTCSRNPDHVETVAATVTKTVTGTPGGSNVQEVMYHAVAEYGGETYEDDHPE